MSNLPESGVLVVGHRIGTHPNIELKGSDQKLTYMITARFLLFAPCHVSSIEVACYNDAVCFAYLKLKCISLRMHVSQLFVRVIAHDAFDSAAVALLAFVVGFVS